MKNFWRKLDEMEQYIIFKAQRNAYLFLVAALVGWTFYESYRVYAYHGRLNPLPGFLLAAAVLIQCFSQLIMTRNAVKDDDDSYASGPLIKIIILICGIFGLAAAITAAILFMSVAL